MKARSGFTPHEFSSHYMFSKNEQYILVRSLCLQANKTRAGFTLVELVITMGIMALISAVVLANYPKLNQEIIMSRAARELASTIRDAQSRASAVKQLPGALPGQFPDNYGVHLGVGTQYQLFSDGAGPNSKVYDIPASGQCPDGECVKSYTFLRGIYIDKITYGTPPVDVGGDVSVLFYRPKPTMQIVKETGAECILGCTNKPYGPFEIYLSSADGLVKRTVVIWTTGQVSIPSQ